MLPTLKNNGAAGYQGPVSSSRRSVSWGAARKTAREKIKKNRAKGSEFARFFFIFSRAVFRAAPQLWTERLEEAKSPVKIELLKGAGLLFSLVKIHTLVWFRKHTV